MKRSQYFLPTLKETPQEATVPSHQLMLRAGLIDKTASGIYSWLPLGVRVLENIIRIIDDEQTKAGCSKVIMPTVQPASLWVESGRYDAYGDEMLRMKDRHGRDMLYAPTSEEVVHDIARHFIQSYKQLPVNLYQINWKFRDEIRPRFGVMRGREFLMKDGYSFAMTPEAGQEDYRKIFDSYIRIFDRIFAGIPDPANPSQNIKAIPVKADTGPIGGDLSHEFQILASHGESQLYFDNRHFTVAERNFDTLSEIYAANDEKHDPSVCPEARTARGIELGHIFYYGNKYSKAMNYTVSGPDGKPIHPYGGCYGIGVSRLIGSIIEASFDEKGIIWPVSVAPFKVGIVNLLKDSKVADEVYDQLRSAGVEVLYDDRLDVSPGIKFAEMDLVGLPYQIIVGKQWTESQMVEIKNRRSKAVQAVALDQVASFKL